MIQLIFTIHDTAASAYLNPFFQHTKQMAQRVFANCVSDQDHAFGRNPSDYTLMQIGEYDDSTATITHHTPESLGNGLEYQNKETT